MGIPGWENTTNSVFGSNCVLEKETLLRFARSLADLRIEVKALCCCTTKACITSDPRSSHKFSCPRDAPLAHDGLLRKPDILICHQHLVLRTAMLLLGLRFAYRFLHKGVRMQCAARQAPCEYEHDDRWDGCTCGNRAWRSVGVEHPNTASLRIRIPTRAVGLHPQLCAFWDHEARARIPRRTLGRTVTIVFVCTFNHLVRKTKLQSGKQLMCSSMGAAETPSNQ
jgi:hypothetical protein